MLWLHFLKQSVMTHNSCAVLKSRCHSILTKTGTKAVHKWYLTISRHFITKRGRKVKFRDFQKKGKCWNKKFLAKFLNVFLNKLISKKAETETVLPKIYFFGRETVNSTCFAYSLCFMWFFEYFCRFHAFLSWS